MKIETRDRRLTVRGTIKDRDLGTLRDALARAIESDEVGVFDLRAVRGLDVHALQLMAVALKDASARGRDPRVDFSAAAHDLVQRVGLDAHLAPFFGEEAHS